MSAVGAAASRMGRCPGRVHLSLARCALTLALLPACESERLVLVNVHRAPDLNDDVQIVSLEARTSLTGFKTGRHENTVGDSGGNTQFPIVFGIYVHSQSGPMTVRLYAYSPGGDEPVAAGQLDVKLNGDREQRLVDILFLHPCDGPSLEMGQLCHPPPIPDGGEVGPLDGGADAAVRVEAGADAADADAGPEDGDGPSIDERLDTNADDHPPDMRADQIDLAPDQPGPDLPDTDSNPDQGDTSADLGDARTDADDAGSIPGPDAGPPPPECLHYCAEVRAPGACPTLFSGQGRCEAECTFARLAQAEGALTCRIMNAQNVASNTVSAEAGCPRASLFSASCDPSFCEVYCALGASVCGDTLFPAASCFEDCLYLDVGTIDLDESGNSLACRITWLQRALDDLRRCNWATLAPTTGPCQAQ